MPDTSDDKRLSIDSSPALDAGVWAAMSHEIRTPLMGVVGMLEILARTPLTDEQRRIIATAGESSIALMRIVDDVLDFAKMESAKLTLVPVATDLLDLLESCTELLANQAEAKGLAITCEAGFDLSLVMCDAVRLRQVLLNIGANAVKFTDAGQVTLVVQSTAPSDGKVAVRFVIADSGIGIPEELHAFLFKPFSQLTISAGRGHGGVGLGLAICRNLVEAMGGTITVESTPGRGTRFSIDLVLPVAAQQAARMPPPRLDGLSVVAVDAGESALAIAVRYLEAAGADVRRVGPISDLGAVGLADLQRGARAPRDKKVVIVIGPDAEAEDVQAASATLSHTSSASKPAVLWLHPQAVGGAQVLARRGVRAVRAHPLRREALYSAITEVGLLVSQQDAPVLTRTSPSGPAGDEDAAAAARAEGRVILVAEDNVVNQQVLRQQLAILGFDCDIAANGNAALQALRERSYLLLLCDCHMPGLDGFELTRLIREGESAGGTHLPIIAITANAMPGEAERCRAAGMDDYLAKPIEISGLQTMLGRWLAPGWQPMHALQEASAVRLGAAAIDLKNLRAVFGNDSSRLKPVLDQWSAVMTDARDEVRRALAQRRWSEMASAVHRIKGSAGIAGARELSAAAARLETLLRNNEVAGAAHECDRLLECLALALAEVQIWRDSADARAPQAAFSAAASGVTI